MAVVSNQLIGTVFEFPAVQRIVIGERCHVGTIVQIKHIKLESPLEYKVQQAFLEADAFHVWEMLFL